MSEPNAIEGDDNDPRLAGLLAWRQQLIASGAVSAHNFKEAHVRMVLRSGRTDAEQIRMMLPDPVGEHADAMARVLSEVPDERARLRSGEISFSPDEFALFTPIEQSGVPAPVALRRGGDGALELSWPTYEAPFVVYRVISSENESPYSPDRAHVVAATIAAEAVDERDAASAVRHYQVWVNAGTSREEALAAQPRLHATGLVVAGVRGMAVRDDFGRVIGQWTVFPGVRAVHVERIPIEESALGGPHYRILAGDQNFGGFVDTDAEGGRRYVYRARCEVIVDGVGRLSEAAEAEVAVTAVLAPVADLSLTVRATDPVTVDLTWTPPPAGRVVMYRTPDGPRAGAEADEIPETAMAQVGLYAEHRLTHPVSQGLDEHARPRAVIAGVPWPRDWSRAYFTPVTLVSGRARLGKTTSIVRTAPIRDVELVEYCNKQVLTFGWPDGAAAVVVYLAGKGHDPRAGLSGRSYEITLEDYERYGGMQFTGELPSGGCSLHLAPVAFSAGRRVLGEITSITYDGLLRLWYSVQIARDSAGWPVTAALVVRGEVEVKGSPPFVLVHNPDRIPLSVNDGQPVDVALVNERGEIDLPPSKEIRYSSIAAYGRGEVWVGDVRFRTGWIRLFANLGDPKRLRRLALLDPPVAALRLTGAPV
jgi:hypothetical protein